MHTLFNTTPTTKVPTSFYWGSRRSSQYTHTPTYVSSVLWTNAPVLLSFPLVKPILFVFLSQTSETSFCIYSTLYDSLLSAWCFLLPSMYWQSVQFCSYSCIQLHCVYIPQFLIHLSIDFWRPGHFHIPWVYFLN